MVKIKQYFNAALNTLKSMQETHDQNLNEGRVGVVVFSLGLGLQMAPVTHRKAGMDGGAGQTHGSAQASHQIGKKRLGFESKLPTPSEEAVTQTP